MFIKKACLTGTILIVLGVMALSGCQPIEPQTPLEDPPQSASYLKVVDFDPGLFLSTQNTHQDRLVYDDVKGIITPHHLLASHLIHDLFASVEGSTYDHVLVMGPDHKNRDGVVVYTEDTGWQTPFGLLPLNDSFHTSLIQLPYMAVDNKKIADDHAITAIIPYVAYYFPHVSINSMILPPTLSRNQAIELGHFLKDTLDSDKTLLVASIDFSHYLSVDTAYEKDSETLEAINNRDYLAISRFTNDHVDSPQTLIAFLTYLDSIGHSEQILLHHKNAYDIVPGDYFNTTSYFLMLYR